MEGHEMRPADMAFFRALVSGVVDAQRRIDPIIHAALPPTWPLTRIDLTLRAILRSGVFELLSRRDIPARVVITEYVDIANAFFSADEPGLVNGLLDRVARDTRPEEFPKAASG
jgi:N utilization substance protein B